MKKTIEFEILDDGIVIDFDNDPSAKYTITVHPEDHADGDGIVLLLNRAACVAFARLFAQLAERDSHVHLGYDQSEPQGPGFRIEVVPSS